MTLPPLGLPGHKARPDSREQKGAPVLWRLAHQRGLGLILSAVPVHWRAPVDSFINILTVQGIIRWAIRTLPGAHIPVVHLVTVHRLCPDAVMPAVARSKLHLSLLYQSQWKHYEPGVWCGEQLREPSFPVGISYKSHSNSFYLSGVRFSFWLVYVLCFGSGVCFYADCLPPYRMGWLKIFLPTSQTGRLITQVDSEYSEEWILELYLPLFFIHTFYSPPDKQPFLLWSFNSVWICIATFGICQLHSPDPEVLQSKYFVLHHC